MLVIAAVETQSPEAKDINESAEAIVPESVLTVLFFVVEEKSRMSTIAPPKILAASVAAGVPA
jgi:hypothetical protein